MQQMKKNYNSEVMQNLIALSYNLDLDNYKAPNIILLMILF